MLTAVRRLVLCKQSVEPLHRQKPRAAIKSASIFRNGVNQAVRLPQEFRFPEGVKDVQIRRPIGNLDLLIAAHALALGATLITNPRHFGKIAGLKTEIWFHPG